MKLNETSVEKKAAQPTNGCVRKESFSDMVLGGQPETVRSEILAVMREAGLEEDDPYWLILVQYGYVESALHTMPHLCREVLKETMGAIEKLTRDQVPEALKNDLRADMNATLQEFARQNFIAGKHSVYGRPVNSYIAGGILAMVISLAGLLGGLVTARLAYEHRVRQALVLYERNGDRIRACMAEGQQMCSILVR
ncbi:MAG: DUF6753 family protein [Cyanobacteria bacterium J06642_2]